ncbi:hemolysin family protein [Parvibaculum sp.]|jgi:CBS domain containing-hemolysin-like protein|uniref:hemolysin family protein n=1 Tax=Parvibaculum sp. TaxID=2024848 RepID=UPI001B02D484|nr:hemolysin family protein [Parvibaculum sp.]MBO6633965.1 HlyC/CorC family transporter [Parvibaculum sp.]MBO6677553.1 HlyC/CorC family transporter [Parvibaculum sp.]MBO6685346.1 HlyC/CorC family transporter [Parvibaculum sp.]MBO6905214.1 HlyC/CorC family transporter [Parvibaculum sp.]
MADTTDRSSTLPVRDDPAYQRNRQRLGWLRTLLGLNGNGDSSLRESLEEVIEEHEDIHRSLTAEERHMLVNILKFGELRVDDVMVPRADVIGVEEAATMEEVLRLYRDSSHSRMPIYRETLDDPIGMVHLKDVLAWLAPVESEGAAPRPPFSLRSIRREVLFVPPSMPALDLLVKMQATRIHLALVIDEYGGTDGLVSIEDLVEEIVGEIEDEHDIDSGPSLVKREDGSIDADARCPIEDLEEMIGVTLVEEEYQDDVDTLGGLVFSLLGRVPLRGELVRHPAGLEFEVKDADPRRIKRMRIHLLPGADAEAASEAEG